MRRILAAVLIAPLLLSGCWDRREMDQLAIAEGLAVDYDAGIYTASAEVVNTRAVTAPGQGGGKSAFQPESLILRGKGPTPESAITDLDRLTTRFVFWPSLKLIIVGEQAARQGFAPLLAAVTRASTFRLTPQVMISHGTAKSLLESEGVGPETSVSQALAMQERIGRLGQSSTFAPRVYDLLRWNSQPERTWLIAAVTPTSMQKRAPEYSLGSSAVVVDDKLVDWVPTSVTQMLLWMEGEFVHGGFTVACASSGETFSFEIDEVKTHLTPIFTHGVLQYLRIDLNGRAVLTSSTCGRLPLSQASTLASAEVWRRAADAGRWAQDHGYDVLGWATRIYRSNHTAWESHLAKDWPHIYARVPTVLSVRVHIGSSGWLV